MNVCRVRPKALQALASDDSGAELVAYVLPPIEDENPQSLARKHLGGDVTCGACPHDDDVVQRDDPPAARSPETVMVATRRRTGLTGRYHNPTVRFHRGPARAADLQN